MSVEARSEDQSLFSPAVVPAYKPMVGWKDVPIEESGQPLISLNDLVAADIPIVISPQYYLGQIPNALEVMYAREEVAVRLIGAAARLPQGHKLVIFDAYRPVSVQSSLFETFRQKLAQENPGIDDEDLSELTQVYVSLPSLDPKKPSPHNTGGAIDLSIEGPDGRLLEMGTPFDAFDIESQTIYFEGKSDRAECHSNRGLLYRVMVEAGFTNYPDEWWHFDYGNQFWGFISGRKSIYGAMDKPNS